MSVAFRNVTKRFANGTIALDKLEFEFPKGEFIIFLGPSGSGKTTACRCLAGLEEITSGQVLVDDQDITHLPPRERNMSMVFQNYALYSHKIVYENIAYPLRIECDIGAGIRGDAGAAVFVILRSAAGATVVTAVA